MRRGAILQAVKNVQSRREENHVEHRVTGKTAPPFRSTQSGRAQVRTSSTHIHGTRTTSVPGRSSEDVEIMVRAFLAEKGVQANSKAWHNAMQSKPHTTYGNRTSIICTADTWLMLWGTEVTEWEKGICSIGCTAGISHGTDLNHTHRRPPLRHGRRRHGSSATGHCLDAMRPTRRDYLRRMSSAHTEPSLVAAVTLCWRHRVV